MASQLGFYFDQTLCTGCKACQISCTDKHDTPIGVNWRRVVTYEGGGWQKNGDTFTNNVFSYYTSISCNHCENPICVEVCPTTAMHQGEDGIVTVDSSICVGCRFCEWACPYSAPQFNVDAGYMTKCDMCADYRATDQDPACVAACPSRALDWGPIDDLQSKYGNLQSVAPLPDPAITNPHLVITPHAKAENWENPTGVIVNRTEVHPA